MAWTRNFAWIIAAAVFGALWSMPSVALAHDGHAHRAPAIFETSSSSILTTSATTFGAGKDSQIEISITAAKLAFNSGSSTVGCGSGCCDSMAGMACCGGGALIPSAIEALPISVSSLFDFDQIFPAHGLPPEALPKPPKAFA
jgi:hypothetical protein